MAEKSNRLIWIDLEMTGLNPNEDRILEIATIVTDSALQMIAEGPVFAIHQTPAVLNAMNEWNTTHHGASGLTQRVQESRVTEPHAEVKTLEFLKQHVEEGASPMCGNTIYQDRRFLAKYMPILEAYFHYRMIDVSTVKELARRWRPDLYNQFKKESKHLALDDIKESIAELKYYQGLFFQLI